MSYFKLVSFDFEELMLGYLNDI